MLRRPLLFALCLLPLGCAEIAQSVPDTARLAPGQLGTGGDPDVTAVNLAQWAFADPSRTYDRPVEAARAAAAMDYIAGELNTSPRWANISALTQQQLLLGRLELRQALGVAPGAPSQAVVNSLTAAASALQAGNEPAAVRELGPPVFNAPGPTVLARLRQLPYLRMANVSTMKAANELFRPSNGLELF